MDFQKILENKPLLYGLIGGLVVVLALFITVGIVVSSNNSGAPKAVKEKVIDKPLDLLTTDNLGKAIEIQALLAREGITVERRADGQKSVLYLQKYTMTQRDRALLAIVKSGLVDQMDEFIHSSIDLTKNSVINSDGQTVSIDQTG